MLCATVGSVQANEAVKLLCGIGDPLVGRLLIYDALELSFKDIAVRKDGVRRLRQEPDGHRADRLRGVLRRRLRRGPAGRRRRHPAQLKSLLDDGQQLKLVDVREPAEWQINRLPGGDPDPARHPAPTTWPSCPRPSR